MKAYVMDKPGSFSWSDVEPYDAPPDWVTVAPTYVGLCGSDLHVYEGLLGPIQFPRAIGHEIVGIAQDGEFEGKLVAIDPVEGCGRCARCKEGQENVCAQIGIVGMYRDGGLAERVVISQSRLYLVPESISPTLSGITEALAVAVHAVDRVKINQGDVIAVIGGGPIGMLTSIVARDRGGRVIITEPAKLRRDLADRIGFETIDPVAEPGALAETLGTDRADIVFECAAHPSVSPSLTSLVRSGGTIVQVGVHTDLAQFNLSDITRRELTLHGTRALSARDTPAALELITRRPDDLNALIDDTLPPEGTQDALERLKRGEAMKILIDTSELSGA
jgi:threonine dehydrogenase-like Zn-dependent dehydrogenase